MAIATFTKAGAKATTAAKLDASVFSVTPKNHELLKLAYDTYLSNSRENLAVTKTRGLVSGGGRKPWKQKGTGRARFGSSRNPIWRGGGIAFGPTGQENYVKQLNTKAKRLAIRQALSLSAADNKVTVIESLPSSGKTNELASLLTKVGAVRNVLIVTDAKTPELIQASQNLSNVIVVSAKYINVFNVLNADTVLITKPSLDIIKDWLGEEK
ncbi:MAG: ribosomal protein [Candidatus Saccharibacteria bacterium]|nr:ribosomal protein [Candidatus Saccharibacteria bacterium]